jgi:hypothetical protein
MPYACAAVQIDLLSDAVISCALCVQLFQYVGQATFPITPMNAYVNYRAELL